MKSTLRKITHKGEIEVEEETYKDLDTRLEESTKDYEMDKASQALADTYQNTTSLPLHVSPFPRQHIYGLKPIF